MSHKRIAWIVGIVIVVAGLLPVWVIGSPESPVGVTFTIALPRGQFHMGEVIPIDMTFRSTMSDLYHINMASYDRSGRMSNEQFEIEPRDGWSDPLSDYFNTGLFSFMGGGIRGVPELNSEPKILHLDLNEWVRFDRPGHYRLTITSSRVIEDRTERNPVGKPIKLASNSIEFDVIPADVSWSQQEVAAAVAELNSTDNERRRQAARALRWLGTDGAVNAMVEALRGDENGSDWECMFGLIGAPNRKYVVEAMRERLQDAEHPINATYLRTLSALAYLLDHAEPLAPPPAMPYDENAPEWKVWRTNVSGRQLALKSYVERFLNMLTESLPKRRGRSFGTTMTTVLIEGAEAGLLSRPEFGGFLEQLRSEMPRILPQLPAGAQSSLLDFWWEQIRSPEMVPVLRSMYDSTPNFTRGTYLKLIADLDPKLARELVMEDMQRPDPTLLYDEINVLGNELLPAMDTILASRLSDSAVQSSPALGTFAKLVQRHATAAIASRVEATYTNLVSVDCYARAQLIAYFLRVDFGFGKSSLERIESPAGQRENGCALSALNLALERDLPRVEDVAIERLQNADPYLAAAAAESLQFAGSAAAEKHIMKQLTRWHARWQEQEDELRKTRNRGEAQLGTALIEAVAHGKSWLANGVKLEELRSFCVTTEQCERIAAYQAKWERPPELEIIVFDHERVWPHIAQYEMQSLAQLWQRLKQFPGGTTLTCVLQFGPNQAGHADRILAEVKKFGEDQGINIKVKSSEK